MKRIKFNRLAFYCMFLFIVVFGSGCAGPKPSEKEKSVTMERSDKSKIPMVSERPGKETFVDEKGERFEVVSTPSGYVKQRVGRAETERSESLPKEAPSVLPKPDLRSAKASAALKPGQIRTASGSAGRRSVPHVRFSLRK